MEELNGIALSQEELLVALLLAKLPALAGFDDLETRVFGTLPDAFRPMLLAAGERGLLARGILTFTEAESALNDDILTLLQTCAKPTRTWLIVHQPRGQSDRTTYVHQAAQMIAHTEALAIHQFIELNGTGDLRTIISGLIAIDDAPPISGLRGMLAEPTFAKIVTAEDPVAALVPQLRVGGLADNVADAFAASISQRTGITACALFEHQRESAPPQVVTVISSPAGHWAIMPHTQNTVRIQQVDGALLIEALDRLGAVAETHS